MNAIFGRIARRAQGRRAVALALSVGLGLGLAALLLAGLRAPAAAAAGLGAPDFACNEAGLNSAIAAGGSATFNCSVPITITSVKNVLKNLTLNGSNNLILTGNKASGVFSVPVGVHLSLLNLTIRDAMFPTIDNYGSVDVSNVKFLSDTINSLDNEPGAVAVVADSLFSGTLSKVGAIVNGGFLISQTAVLTVSNSTFEFNRAGYGAAIEQNGGWTTVTGSSFFGNRALAGGAIYANQGHLNVSNSTFVANTASSKAFLSQADSPDLIAGSAVITYAGGAIFLTANADANISDSHFSHGYGEYGAGAIMYGDLPIGLFFTSSGHELVVTGSTFDMNCTGGPGGAIYAGQAVTVSDSSFSTNLADSNSFPCIIIAAAQGSQPAPARQSNAPNAPAILLPSYEVGAGGAIYSSLYLSVDNSQFLQNEATFTDTGGGGAISTYFGNTLHVSTSGFQGNQAKNDGGAIFNEAGAIASVVGSTFTGNTAKNDTGGAITNLGNMAVRYSSFTANSGAPGDDLLLGGGGGAIFSGQKAPIVSDQPNGNGRGNGPAGNGPALQLPQGFVSNMLVVDHSTFFSNSSLFEGGALDAGPAVISTSSFISNAALYGGAIDVWTSPFTLLTSSLIGNDATAQGGAIDANTWSPTVVNSTFYNNRAEGSAPGGAINADSGTVSMTNSTLISNTAVMPNRGGGLGGGGGFNLHNTLVAFNSGGNCSTFSTITLTGHNLEYPNTDCGGAFVQADPKIQAPANNGGPTLTAALLPGSPAINAGNNSGCPVIDQRGGARPRTVGNPCDIGAYEFGAQVPFLWMPIIMK